MFRKESPNLFVERKELLGMGSFGAVYKGILLNSPAGQEEVAVKVISYNGDELNQLGRELYFLKNLSSPFIVKYVDSFVSRGELWIVMELCDSGSLLDICQATKSCLQEPELKAVLACCILGLVHIHERRSIHRDIKAGNILLSSRGKAMLSDFGVSTQLTDSNRRRTVIGTPYWMAPEILQETSYGENADIWSLGITIIECAQGQPPHFDAKPLRAMYMIASKPAPRLADESNWSSDMIHFLDRCLQKDPYERATSAELEKHVWITEELKEIRESESKGLGASLAILRTLARNTQQAIEEMRRARQESSDTSTFQTFSAKIDDINTMETEAAKGGGAGTWRTMETEAAGQTGGGPGTWRTAAFNNASGLPPTDIKNQKTPRLSDIATWNANNFNTAGFSASKDPGGTGALSEVSTPENTMRKPPTTAGPTKTGTIDTLRNQLGTMKLNQPTNGQGTLPFASARRPSGESNSVATLRNQLDSESRATLRKQLNQSRGIADSDADTDADTMRNELDPASRATLQQQLRSGGGGFDLGSQLDGGRQRAQSIPNSSSRRSVDSSASTHIADRTTPELHNVKPKETLRFQSDSANVSTLKRGLQWDMNQSALEGTSKLNEFATVSVSSPNPKTFSGEVTLSNGPTEPFLAIQKFDSNGYEDEHSMPPLAPHQAVLTCQEGSLKFDNHEIQFKMAIYGSGGRSTGCRMEVRFGNVGES